MHPGREFASVFDKRSGRVNIHIMNTHPATKSFKLFHYFLQLSFNETVLLKTI